MKKLVILVAIIFILLAGFILKNNKDLNNLTTINSSQNSNNKMKVKSVFENNGEIPVKYTCDGEDLNPPLEFLDYPENTKSFALIVDDPDAPVGTWVHWVVWNIENPIVREGEVPENSREGINDFKKLDYGGPCPPSGIHRYFFRVYALDSFLELKEGASREDLEKAMEGHILEKAELVGVYSRK